MLLGIDASIADAVQPGLELSLDETKSLPTLVVEAVERHNRGLILRLRGIDDKDTADALAKSEVFVARTSLPAAGADEYYDFDVIGASVSTDDGRDLGRVIEIIVTGANDVYVANGPEGEVLIPAIDAAITHFDSTAKRIVVNAAAVEFSSKKEPR